MQLFAIRRLAVQNGSARRIEAKQGRVPCLLATRLLLSLSLSC
jgi:hypothetical protein